MLAELAGPARARARPHRPGRRAAPGEPPRGGTQPRSRRRSSSPSAAAPAHSPSAPAPSCVAAGGRSSEPEGSGVEQLTASERRVAELAAEGHSNPEIAQALFVTRKTVETHLGHVYRKLGITVGRLAGRSAGRDGSCAP